MDIKYWIWLSLSFSLGSSKPRKIIDIFKDAKSFYDSVPISLKRLDFLTEKDIEKLKRKSLSESEYIISQCKKHCINILLYDDERFPILLKDIYSPPIVIYYKGDISFINELICISIVGTRKPTEYGKYVTGNLSYQLAKQKVCIVSGCAVGIDAMAHIGALKAGGKTIAFLGCGLDVNYPAANKELKDNILINGALLSEMPPGSKAKSNVFPIRNRLISGISRGIIVTEAPIKSGALITVEHAIDQNRDVFCVPPHNIYDNRYSGVVKYLNDGALPVYGYENILKEYVQDFKFMFKNNVYSNISNNYINNSVEVYNSTIDIVASSDSVYLSSNDNDNSDLDEEGIEIYKILTNEPKHIEQIVSETKMDLSKTLSILTELEILGKVISYSGNRYSISN